MSEQGSPLASLAFLGIQQHHPDLCLHLHCFPGVYSCPQTPFLMRTLALVDEAHPSDAVLTCLPLEALSPIRAIISGAGARLQQLNLGRYSVTCKRALGLGL